jgi:hypothetical protein
MAVLLQGVPLSRLGCTEMFYLRFYYGSQINVCFVLTRRKVTESDHSSLIVFVTKVC